MELGDFTQLARYYVHRPAYSEILVSALLKHVDFRPADFKVADIGAGTGKLTKMLLERGVSVVAVEPNDAMREEGVRFTSDYAVSWIKGSGEATNLQSDEYNWVVMASSFHWTNPQRSLTEFHRILKRGGYFTAVWNPRNLEGSELHSSIEDRIYSIVPHLQRVSSGSRSHTKKWEEILISTGHFKDVVFMEVDYVERMSRERYMGIWNSVNDIRSQAGEHNWEKIVKAIEDEIADLDNIEVPYKNRAWTAQRVG